MEVHDFLVTGRPELEFLCVMVASLVVGGFLYFLISRLLTPKKHLRQVIRSSAHGLGISRSSTLFFATLVYDAIAHGIDLPRLLDAQVHTWVVFVRILCFGWLVSVSYQVMLTLASENGRLQGDKQRKILVPFARKLGSALILILTFVSALAVAGMNVWGMAAGLGIGGIAVAFAAKDSVENLFGSATVMIDMPFGVGDWVKIDSVEGVVEEINLRSTRIRTFEDSLVTMPNSTFIKAAVENMGQRRSRRIRTSIFLDAPRNAGQIQGFTTALVEGIKEIPQVQGDSVVAGLFELKETGAVVQVVGRFAIDSYREELECRQNVLLAAISIAAEQGLHFKSQPNEELPRPPASDPKLGDRPS